jgi:hypothetical protein
MAIQLQDLDHTWSGTTDLSTFKLLCRKYSPRLLMEFIERGLSISNKSDLIIWHKTQLSHLGSPVIDPPSNDSAIIDDQFKDSQDGDYFS